MSDLLPGDRVVLVDCGDDTGRTGMIMSAVAMDSIARTLVNAQPEVAATIYGKPDHLIVLVDRERSDLSRNYKRLCVTAAQIERLVVIASVATCTRPPTKSSPNLQPRWIR